MTPDDLKDTPDGADENSEDEESSKPKKMIDFNEQLANLKKRTERNFPYTLIQTEDTMFIDKDSAVCLEYYYYQNGCKYTPLSIVNESINEFGVLVNESGHECIHKLSTHVYELPENEPFHPMSMWPRESIKNLRDSGVDILKQQKYLKEQQFLTVDGTLNVADELLEEENDAKVSDAALQVKNTGKKKRAKHEEPLVIEGVIAKYRVCSDGRMIRIANASLTMGKKFFPSRNGNM